MFLCLHVLFLKTAASPLFNREQEVDLSYEHIQMFAIQWMHFLFGNEVYVYYFSVVVVFRQNRKLVWVRCLIVSYLNETSLNLIRSSVNASTHHLLPVCVRGMRLTFGSEMLLNCSKNHMWSSREWQQTDANEELKGLISPVSYQSLHILRHF